MDFQGIVEFDRQLLSVFNGNHTAFLDTLMTTLTSGPTWIPLYIALLYLVIKNNETMTQVMVIVGSVALCFFLTEFVTEAIVKPTVARPRPLNDPVWGYDMHVVGERKPNDFSFFSAHAANTASLTVFLCLVVRHRALSIALVCWSLLNGYTRLYLGMHFPLDVLTGFIAGSLIALFVYTIYRWVLRFVTAETRFISSQYTSTGYSLDDVDVVMLVMALTIFFAVLRALIIAL